METSPKVNIKRSKGFFSEFETVTLSATFYTPQSSLSTLTRILKGVLDDLTALGTEVRNKRGREPNGEVFFLDGILPQDEGDIAKEKGLQIEYSIKSEFSRFDDRKSLVEKLSEKRSQGCPAWISIKNIYKIAPFFPQTVRFGLQFYKVTHLSALLGSAPKVVAQILIEANENQTIMEIQDQSMRGDEMIHTKNIIDRLSSVFTALRMQ